MNILALGYVADAEEHAFDVERARGAVGHIAQAQAFHGRVFDAEHFIDDRVGAQLDVRVGDGALQHDLRGTEGVAAVEQCDLGGEAGEEERFFHGRVAAAHDGDGFAAKEEAVAGGAA